MAVEFRCEKCGKALSADGAPDSKIKCPYCKARVTIPAGLASLPRPQVPPGTPGAAPPPLPGQGAPAEAPEPLVEEPDVLMNVMATVMPWVISIFFHVGVLVILGFITIVLIDNPAAEGGVLDPGESDPDMEARSMQKIQQNKWAQRDSRMPTSSMGETTNRVQVIGISGGASSGSSAAFGLTTGGSGTGPKSNFFGTGGNAYHIVYVVDRSGSMLDTLDLVKKEMLRSICRLSPAQTFHVIFFATGKPLENAPRRLVYANEDYKREAMKYLKTIHAQGRTDPIPALRRAFTVLQRTPNQKRGKLVYLLTDGEFQDNEQVLKTVKELNKSGQIYINTILHHHESPPAVKVLKAIAKENGGRFKFIPPSE